MRKIDLDDRSRYVKRLHSRVMRRRRLQIVVLSVVVAAIMVWISATAFNTLKNFRFPSLSFGKKTVAKKAKKPKYIFAVIGVDQREYEQYVSGISLIVYNPEDKSINSLAFKKEVRLQIPGYGLDVLEKALFAGNAAALATITNVTGIDVSKYVIVDSADYGISKAKLRKFFSKGLESNIKEEERLELLKVFKKVDESKINVLEAPTKLIALGDKPYEQIKKDEINRLVRVLWDLDKPIKRKKVIVLNGVGTSGLAGKVAIKLIKTNYEVIDIKNASSFNYKNTLIIIYSQSMQKQAMKVQKLIGYGNIMLELDKQGLTDMTVIIGKDHKKSGH
ncbi:MAG: LytR family transcriptional regulator [Actinobacteria bacterium]|nr:MAG: LytR family transcriptional regulator [Actinomycetota bacterium]